jgi:hypothetical protein
MFEICLIINNLPMYKNNYYYFFFNFFNNIVTIPTLTKTPIPIIKYVIKFGVLLSLSNFDLSESTRNGDDDDGDGD